MSNKGDIYDVKSAIALVLRSQDFRDTLASVVLEKGLTYAPTLLSVYTFEPILKQLFPMAEILGYRVSYTPDTEVKEGGHRIGVRWTVNEDTEEAATRNVELLARATVDTFWDQAGSYSGLLSNHDIGAGPVSVTEEDYSPLFPSSATAFMRSVVVILEVSTERD